MSVSKTHMLLFAGALCFASLASGQATYENVHSDVNSENFSGQGGIARNTTANEMEMTVSGSEWYEQTIAGSTDGAPWSTPFTPLNSVFHLRTFSATRTVPPGYWLIVDTKYTVETGSEKWKKTVLPGEGQQPIVSWPTRTRLWYIPNGEAIAVLP